MGGIVIYDRSIIIRVIGRRPREGTRGENLWRLGEVPKRMKATTAVRSDERRPLYRTNFGRAAAAVRRPGEDLGSLRWPEDDEQ